MVGWAGAAGAEVCKTVKHVHDTVLKHLQEAAIVRGGVGWCRTQIPLLFGALIQLSSSIPGANVVGMMV